MSLPTDSDHRLIGGLDSTNSIPEYSDASFLCDRLRFEVSDSNPRVTELSAILHRFLTISISVDFLKSTKIGFLVNSLRKQYPTELGNISKELINRWKSLVNTIANKFNETATTAATQPIAVASSETKSEKPIESAKIPEPKKLENTEKLESVSKSVAAKLPSSSPSSNPKSAAPIPTKTLDQTTKNPKLNSSNNGTKTAAVSPAAAAAVKSKNSEPSKTPVNSILKSTGAPMKSAAAQPQSKPQPRNAIQPASADAPLARKRLAADVDFDNPPSKKFARADSAFEEEVIMSSADFPPPSARPAIVAPLYNPNAHLLDNEYREHNNNFSANNTNGGNSNSADSNSNSNLPVRLCSLTHICVEYIQFHLSKFTHFDQLPSRLIPEIFSRATPSQLKLFELNNSHLIIETDILWKNFIIKKFPDFDIKQVESKNNNNNNNNTITNTNGINKITSINHMNNNHSNIKNSNTINGSNNPNTSSISSASFSWRSIYQQLEAEKQNKINEVGQKLKAKQQAANTAKSANSIKSIDSRQAIKTLARQAGTGISIPKIVKPNSSGGEKLSNIRMESQKIAKSLWNSKSFSL